ncbi:MAG: hypothetical protein KGZ60_03720 [Truepera sp.]|nr:hypothetical protein [Truepera sp.]
MSKEWLVIGMTGPSQAFLSTVYQLSRAGRWRGFNAFEIGRNLGFSDHTTRTIIRQLAQQGLLEELSPDLFFSISNEGLRQAERLRA